MLYVNFVCLVLAYEYCVCEIDVKRSVKRDRRARAAIFSQRAELVAYAGNTRELYHPGRELCIKLPASHPIVDKSGKLFATLEEQMRRRHEHFSEVFHTPNDDEDASVCCRNQ